MNESKYAPFEHGDFGRPSSTVRPRPSAPVRGYYLHRGYSDKQLQAIEDYMSATSEFGILIEVVAREKKVNVFSDNDVCIFEEKYRDIIDATYVY